RAQWVVAPPVRLTHDEPANLAARSSSPFPLKSPARASSHATSAQRARSGLARELRRKSRPCETGEVRRFHPPIAIQNSQIHGVGRMVPVHRRTNQLFRRGI